MSLANALRDRDVTQLPSRRDEDWRWTDLRGLIRTLPEPARPFTGDPGPGRLDAHADVQRVMINGGEAQINAIAGEDTIVALRLISRGAGSHTTRVNVTLGEGARLRLLETYESDAASVSHIALTISLAEGAALERIILADDDAEAVSVSEAAVALAAGSAFHQTVVTCGARRQRIETHVTHPGGKAEVRLDGLYILAGKAHADQTTVVNHVSPDGSTAQLTKGVVADQARGVFQGRIVVAPGADRTDAKMGHHALILSDRAEADAKPELEIYADDVACAHGNTVGALDDDALFYARQRGMSENEARALLTEAFIGEVVDRIGHDGVREAVRDWVADRLRA